MLGYFFFGITCLVVIGFTLLTASKPNLGGDGAMGYGLALAFFGLAFTVSSLILTLCVGRQNGFDWVLTAGATRNVLIGVGWLSIVATTFFCAVFKWEWHQGGYPQFLRWLAVANAQTWMPLLMLVPYFFLLNTETRASVSPNTYKIPLMICFALSVIYSMGLLFGWLRDSSQRQIALIERMSEDGKRIHDEHLTYIAEQKPTDGILNILALTGRFHDEDVRLAAVAKVKSHPNWEADLLRLLDNEYYYTEVYTFIDGNKVEHPEKFLEPLNRSILRLADKISKSIKDANDLQDWHYENFGIERLLRAIDEQFLNKGMDFRPAVVKLQQALKTTPPERFKNVRFTVTPMVDNWLKTH